MKSIKLLTPLLVFTLLTSGGNASAATITWSAAQNITGAASDVQTTGISAYAYSFDATAASQTLNGVTFASTGALSTSNFKIYNSAVTVAGMQGTGSAPFSTLSAPYNAILSNFASSSSNQMYISFNNLTIGNQYELQFFVEDSAGYYNAIKNETFGSSGSVAYDTTGAALAATPLDPAVPGGLGQYLVGTFTADSTTLGFLSVYNTDGYFPRINAFQVRDISPTAAPEPSTWAMLVLGLGGLAIALRRRQLS